MVRRSFLKEHMNHIYLAENIIPHFSRMKSNVNKIGDALASFNIIRIHNVFNFVNDVSIDDIDKFAQKKYSKYYRKIKIKKGNDKVRKLLVSYYSALLTIKDSVTDPDVRQQALDAIEHVDDAGDELIKASRGNKISIIGVAHIIEHLLKGSVFSVSFLKSGGQTFMAACVMLLSLAATVNLFMSAKKEFKKVID